MHANYLITFDLHEILRAGERSLKSPMRLVIPRMGANRGVSGVVPHSLHAIVIVSSETEVLAAWVNGQNVPVEQHEDRWQLAGDIPAPIRHDSPLPRLDEALPPTARYVTLVCTGGGENTIHADHGVFAPCVLEILPAPLDAPATKRPNLSQ
jgi:hypothetical protein